MPESTGVPSHVPLMNGSSEEKMCLSLGKGTSVLHLKLRGEARLGGGWANGFS